MTTAYFDCFSGISGDMVLGALIDLGFPRGELREGLAKLPLSHYQLKIEKKKCSQIGGLRVEVGILKQENSDRTFSSIRKMIDGSLLDGKTKDLSIKIFHRLAEVEAKIHQQSLSQVHFHEVGATDSIIDIVGSALGINYLQIDRVYSSKIPLGTGLVDCQHGILPLPSPATLELLKGVPVYSKGDEGELVTPTGAAILTTLTDRFGPLPPLKIERIGYGAGERVSQPHKIPNLLRIIVGKEEKGIETDRVVVIETNIDDMNPEIYDYLMEKLFDQGALDVSLSFLQMKKNRPGTLLKVICRQENQELNICFFYMK